MNTKNQNLEISVPLLRQHPGHVHILYLMAQGQGLGEVSCQPQGWGQWMFNGWEWGQRLQFCLSAGTRHHMDYRA